MSKMCPKSDKILTFYGFYLASLTLKVYNVAWLDQPLFDTVTDTTENTENHENSVNSRQNTRSQPLVVSQWCQIRENTENTRKHRK